MNSMRVFRAAEAVTCITLSSHLGWDRRRRVGQESSGNTTPLSCSVVSRLFSFCISSVS